MKTILILFTFSTAVSATHFMSPTGVKELCQRSSDTGKKFGIKYSKKDIKRENSLCSMDFYNPEAHFKMKGELFQLAVCPKLKSTSPALEVFAVNSDLSRDEFIETECSKLEKRGKKLSKYKVSTSCGYTPSVLGYYHISRLLNIGQVPVSVLRTVDLTFHVEQAKLGIRNTRNRRGWLPRNWNSLFEQLENGRRSLTHEDGEQSFGAMVDNPKGETVYRALYGKGLKGYTKHAIAKQARKRGAITRQFSKTFSNLPKLFALKDYTDMLIIDAILSQFDRYGNVHFWKYFYYLEDGKLKRKKYNKDKVELNTEMESKGAIVVRRLLLKDNDCGIAFRNRTIDDKALRRIRHFSRETYQNLQKMHTLLNTLEFEKWLKTHLKFTDKDVRLIKNNTASVYNLIKKGVDSRKILLDLNPEDFK